VELAVGVQAARYREEREVTDAWCADKSTAGQRALRVGRGSWVQVASAGRRTLGGSGPTNVSALRTLRCSEMSSASLAFHAGGGCSLFEGHAVPVNPSRLRDALLMSAPWQTHQ